MPFYRRWDTETRTYVVDRNVTGPPKPNPSTGTTVADSGNVIARASGTPSVDVPPATPVQVNFPGPNEPMVDARGIITARWWRFFDELYHRTGGVYDNINRVPTTLLGAGSAGSLAITGYAPTVEIDHIRDVGLGSVTITGYAPTIT